VLVWQYVFVKENFFIEGGKGTNRYGAVIVIPLSKHLPELFRLVFEDVRQVCLHTCSAPLANFLKVLVCLSSTRVFLPMFPLYCFVLPSGISTHCVEPWRHVFGPSVWVLVIFRLSGLDYSCFHRFRYQKFLNHLCACFVVLLILSCDRVEFLCELVCGGVRLPFLRAAHIFCCFLSSYP
jgi:hypothetical protein